MIRSEVGKNITARLTPSIEFIADGIPENAALIESLLNEARSRDAESTTLAQTAQYAGDEDPYVKPRVFVEDDEDTDPDNDDTFDVADDADDADDDATFESGPRP